MGNPSEESLSVRWVAANEALTYMSHPSHYLRLRDAIEAEAPSTPYTEYSLNPLSINMTLRTVKDTYYGF
jgi:hypothetical protein